MLDADQITDEILNDQQQNGGNSTPSAASTTSSALQTASPTQTQSNQPLDADKITDEILNEQQQQPQKLDPDQITNEIMAQNGSLKKDDLDSYFDLVKAHALDTSYDPANQTAQDNVNGIDSRDYNFDIYNARYNQGFKTNIPWTETAWNTAKGLIPGIAHSALDPAFWGRIGETAMQTLPMMAPGAGAVGVEAPSISGRGLKQNVAELGAAGEVASDQDIANLRPLGDDLTTSFKNLDENEKNAYFDRRVQDQYRIEKAATGQGYLDQALGIGRDVKDVAGVKDAADFALLHPAQDALIFGAGPVGGLIGKGVGLAAGLVPEGLGEGVNGLIGSAAKIASKYATPGIVGSLTTAEEYNRTGDLRNSILAGIAAGGTDSILKIQNNLSDFGDYMKGNLRDGYTPPLEVRMAQGIFNKANDIASSPIFQTALGGAAYSVPFALAQDDPNKRVSIILNGLAAGAGLGAVSRLGGLLDARYASNENANFYKNIPTDPTEYGTQYDAPNADSVSRMSQSQKDLLFKQRYVVGKYGQIYVIPDDQFQNVIQPLAKEYYTSQGHTPEMADNLASNVNGESVYYGADATGNPRIFVKESAFTADNMTHEVGHFVSDVVRSNFKTAQQAAQTLQQNGQPISPELQATLDAAKQLDASVPTGKSRQVAEQGYINRLYNLDSLQDQIDDVQKQADTGDVNAQARLDNLNKVKAQYESIHENGLPDNIFKNEWLSDQFSLASRGLASGKQAGYSHAISSSIGSFLDTVAPGAVSQYLTTRQTPLGFRPSFIAADVFDNWIKGRVDEIKAQHPDWKPNPPNPVSANNAPTESSIPPTSTESIIQPTGKVVQDATDALTGLKVFGKRAVAGKVSEAIESLRSQGVDISKINPIDIVAEATKGRGQTPTEISKQQEQTTPLQGISSESIPTNQALQGIAEPKITNSSETPPKPVGRTLDEIDPNGFVDAQEMAQLNYKNKADGGLKRASNRSVNKKDLTVNDVPQTSLVGQRIDTSQPLEAALLRQGTADADNPQVFQQSLAAIQDAIAQQKTLSVSYNSADNSLEGVPSSQSRENARDLSDKGFVNRSPTPKTINPTSIEILRKNEPYFDGDSKAVALQNANDFDFKGKRIYKDAAPAQKDLNELYAANAQGRIPNIPDDPNGTTGQSKVNFLIDKFVPSQFKTRFYANSYSFDKMAGNEALFPRVIVDSQLQNDPLLTKVKDYLKSPEFLADEKGRLLNSANGLRGDGQPIEGSLVKPTPGYKPYYLDDFKTQVFNALEGGPSPTYYQEANQNVPQLRGIKVNPLDPTQGANPLWNHLLKLGDKVKLFEKGLDGSTVETNGIKNIFSPATEQIRLDRINNINLAPEEQQMPTSKYGNRSIGFTSGTGIAPGTDATINPASRNLKYKLQGIAGAYSEPKSQ